MGGWRFIKQSSRRYGKSSPSRKTPLRGGKVARQGLQHSIAGTFFTPHLDISLAHRLTVAGVHPYRPTGDKYCIPRLLHT